MVHMNRFVGGFMCILLLVTVAADYRNYQKQKMQNFGQQVSWQGYTDQRFNITILQQKFQPQPDTAGYVIGQVKSKKLLRQSQQSKLYELQVDQMLDLRPIKLLQLIGSHYQVGYDYGALLGHQIVDTYNIFMSSNGFPSGAKRQLLELFLDWQYDSYVSMQIPYCFKQQLKGLQHGGSKVNKIHNLRSLVQRVLVISSYPGDISSDISYSLLDQFLRDSAHIKNQKMLNYLEGHIYQFAKMVQKFMKKMKMDCSFMAAWGSRTQGGKLYTMRNLDWARDTGINKYKIVFVWKIKDEIPHVTLGFPSMFGALTGMSKAGLTVHEAGLGSIRETQLGFQWTLRLRYIMMRARTLSEARHIWETTNNTLGMNHMIASAGDVASGEPVFVVQTMRNYTAWFKDHDKRQDKTIFIDPKTGKQFVGGFSIKDAVFRTNHAYDPTINKFRTNLPGPKSDTMYRYFLLRDMFTKYQSQNKRISWRQALNITANVADKGSPNFYHCPKGKDNGINIISVMFMPSQLRMYAAFEYGTGNQYRTACCSVYVNIDLKQWF